MGNELQKEYNIKTKPLKLPGAYNFLRFTYHPTQPQSIFIVKSPHKATLMQQSTLIMPIYQIKNLSSSNDTIALCPKCIPLSLVKPKSQTQMKIIMYKILKIGSQIGRCFLINGRVMVWCEQRRSVACMAPQQIQLGKSNDKSKVFVSGIALLNFLACVYDEKMTPNNNIKKQDKKKKSQPKSQTQRMIVANNNNTITNSQLQNNSSGIFQYTAQTLPQQIKLFFQPKDQKEYFQQLQILPVKLPMCKFWTSVSQGMRQLILNMLSVDPTKRVDLDTILGIPYFQSSPQMRMYFMLADGLEGLENKEAVAFMKALEVVIRQGTVFEQQILDEYIVPLLIQMSTPSHSTLHPCPLHTLSPLSLSILIQLTTPPLQTIFMSFKKTPITNEQMILLSLQKKQKLYNLFDQQRFDSIISRMIFCCYQIQGLLDVAVGSTGFVMESIKEEKYKKQIQFKLINKVLNKKFDKQKDKHEQQVFINALKCTIQLVTNNTLTTLKQFTDIIFNPLSYNLQSNIHILYLYKLFIQKLHPKLLWSTMMPKLQPFMSEPQISDELFTTAHRLSKLIIDKMHKQRKILVEDNIELDYAVEYFMVKDKLHVQNYSLQEDVKKIKIHIEKNMFTSIQWIAKEVLI